MKNQVIEALTTEHGKKVIKYWKSMGVDTRNRVGSSCKSDGDTYRYYGVIAGEFDNYTLRQVEKANAEIIELPEMRGYVFHVPTPELSRAIQVRLFELGYCNVFGTKVIDNYTLKYIFAGNDGCLMWSDKLHKKNEKEYIIGDLNALFYTDQYRRTKKVLELTMQEIAEKLGVDEVKIKP